MALGECRHRLPLTVVLRVRTQMKHLDGRKNMNNAICLRHESHELFSEPISSVRPRNSRGVTTGVSYSRKIVFIIALKTHRSHTRNTLFFQKECRRNMAANINYAHRRPFCGLVDENRMLTRTLKIKIDLYLPLKCLRSVTKRYRVPI